MKNTKENRPAESKFTKEVLAGCKEFRAHRDVLNALLPEGEYTKDEAKKKINAYLSNKIKGGM